MKNKNSFSRRALSLLLSIMMIVSVISVSGFTVCADNPSKVKTMSQSLASSRIKDLANKLQNHYFNIYDQPCVSGYGEGGHGCTNCDNGNVINATWFRNQVNGKVPNSTGLYPWFNTPWGNHYVPSARSCAGFAMYAAWYVVADSNSEEAFHTSRHPNYQSIAFTIENIRAYAKPGDIICGGDGKNIAHAIVFIETSGDSFTYIQCNGTRLTGVGNCKITKHTARPDQIISLMSNQISITGCYYPSGGSSGGGSSGGGSSGTITTSMKKAIDVSDVSSSGYTVTCYVKSTASILRVQFPTWTDRNGQDDLLKTWVSSSYASGSYSGLTSDGYSIYRFRVYASDHNYETGTYHTHIYVYVSGLTEAAISGGTSVNVHNHSYSWVTDYSATCTSSGQQHQHCSVCGNNKNYTFISALGHNWNSWKVTTPATCTSSGVETRTCSRNSSHKETRTISALGHYWSTPTYTWSADNKTCTATRVCTRDSSHKETQTVTTTSQILRQPTMTQTGTAKYTAVFSNSAFGTQTKSVSLPKTYDGFPDVKQGSWYYDSVKYVAQKGYIAGYQNGNFGPNDNLKRQDFVVIIANIAKADLSKYAGKASSFKDVQKGSYYAAAVNWAVANNIVSGYNSTKFGVNDPITREQIATILYKYKKEPAVGSITSTLAKFSDGNNVSLYATTPMAWAVQKNVISGMSDGRLAPTKTASRAEIASIIQRMDQQGLFK